LLAGQTGVKTLPSAWRTLNTDFSNYYLTRASTQLPWRRIVLINVFEMSFLPNGDLIFTASSGGRPGLFSTDQAGSIRSLGMDDGRYPSVSPDGHWLASSHLQSGN
jgi:Tol biopolymer transport system component